MMSRNSISSISHRRGYGRSVLEARPNRLAGGAAGTAGGARSGCRHFEWRHHRTGTARIRRVTLRPDGFASIHADDLGGVLLTAPLVFAGKRLALNYSTSATGSVRVELLDSIGRPIPGYSAGESVEIFGDELDRIVMWRARTDVSALAGQTVRLRFHLRDADLYAFRFLRGGS